MGSGPGRARLVTQAANGNPRSTEMPIYLVERNFDDGLRIPMDSAGAQSCRNIVDGNSSLGVTWIHSYVTPDKSTTYCVYDGPTPEAIKLAAERTGLPVSRVTEVSVLDPYFYH